MRRFKLLNCDGEIYDLSTENAMLFSPGGLGIDRKVDAFPSNNGQIVCSSQAKFQNITGNIIFKGDCYHEYLKFVKFCEKTPLWFLYAPSDEFFYKKVFLQKLSKNEIDYKTNVLNCPVDFIPQSRWYKNITFNKEMAKESPEFPFISKDPKVYDLKKNAIINVQNPDTYEYIMTLDLSGINKKIVDKDDDICLQFVSESDSNQWILLLTLPKYQDKEIKKLKFYNVGNSVKITIQYDDEVFELGNILQQTYYGDNAREIPFGILNYQEPIFEKGKNSFPEISVHAFEFEGLDDNDIVSATLEEFQSYETV